VALVVFHDDYDDDTGILYFRQEVLSTFDGNHLSPDTSGRFDRDVLTTFPTDAPLEAAPVETPAYHKHLPTTMYLLVDHPQPVALSQAVRLEPAENPSPRQFVAAYGVDSLRLTVGFDRLVGRGVLPASWDEATRAHYLALPDDPRYETLAEEIARDADPRFVDNPLMQAFAIKRYLEKRGFYTRTETYVDADDPTAAFLFGTLRGYCVHFAHAAVFLLRSMGIPARVAVGYAVQTNKRAGGSSMLIMSSDAHAWPEVFVDGVGWVTFDVYPERSDEPPRPPVDRDLESVLGEIARKDPSGGRDEDPNAKALEIPWAAIGWGTLWALAGLLALAYAIKLARILLPRLTPGRAGRHALRAAQDALSDVGVTRAFGETREAFARRAPAASPAFQALTAAHLRLALGDPRAAVRPPSELAALAARARRELRRAQPWRRRLAGALNPIGWWFTR